MKKLIFEWDDTKNKTNLTKHGVTFEEAQTVFFDESAIQFDDPDHSIYEENKKCISGGHDEKRI